MPLMRPWMENKLCLDISQTSFSQVGKDVQHSPQIETVHMSYQYHQYFITSIRPCVRVYVTDVMSTNTA